MHHGHQDIIKCIVTTILTIASNHFNARSLPSNYIILWVTYNQLCLQRQRPSIVKYFLYLPAAAPSFPSDPPSPAEAFCPYGVPASAWRPWPFKPAAAWNPKKLTPIFPSWNEINGGIDWNFIFYFLINLFIHI